MAGINQFTNRCQKSNPAVERHRGNFALRKSPPRCGCKTPPEHGGVQRCVEIVQSCTWHPISRSNAVAPGPLAMASCVPVAAVQSGVLTMQRHYREYPPTHTLVTTLRANQHPTSTNHLKHPQKQHFRAKQAKMKNLRSPRTRPWGSPPWCAGGWPESTRRRSSSLASACWDPVTIR